MKYLHYFIELAFAVVLISIDIKIFLVYVFMSLIYRMDKNTDFLRKMIRVFQMGNHIKILAITRKLDIKRDELLQIEKEVESELDDDQIKSLKNDIKSMTQH